MNGDEIASVTGIEDYNLQEVILNHLGGLKLTEMKNTLSHSGWKDTSFNSKPLAWMGATNLALHLYIRSIGYRGSIQEYWNVKPFQKK